MQSDGTARSRWSLRRPHIHITGGGGAHVKALDLRAGVALVQAALSAKGTSEIEDIHWVERGYEDLVGKLQGLGADIRKVTIPDAAFAKNA